MAVIFLIGLIHFALVAGELREELKGGNCMDDLFEFQSDLIDAQNEKIRMDQFIIGVDAKRIREDGIEIEKLQLFISDLQEQSLRKDKRDLDKSDFMRELSSKEAELKKSFDESCKEIDKLKRENYILTENLQLTETELKGYKITLRAANENTNMVEAELKVVQDKFSTYQEYSEECAVEVIELRNELRKRKLTSDGIDLIVQKNVEHRKTIDDKNKQIDNILKSKCELIAQLNKVKSECLRWEETAKHQKHTAKKVVDSDWWESISNNYSAFPLGEKFLSIKDASMEGLESSYLKLKSSYLKLKSKNNIDFIVFKDQFKPDNNKL
jgi:hypothetical protein